MRMRDDIVAINLSCYLFPMHNAKLVDKVNHKPGAGVVQERYATRCSSVFSGLMAAHPVMLAVQRVLSDTLQRG